MKLNRDYFSIPVNEPTAPSTGCYDLLQAIISDLFRVRQLTFSGASAAKDLRTQLRRDAEWIRSDDDYPFPFVWTCENLALDPGKIRHAYFHGAMEEMPRRAA